MTLNLATVVAAVLPVVDYEPPARIAVQPLGSRRPAQLRYGPRSSPHRPRPVGMSPALQSAAAFADATLRRVLEVVDQRRSVAQLHRLLAPGLVESVRTGRMGMAGQTGAALLQRIRVQAVGPGEPPVAVEVFGTYRRGRRVHALACRLERAPAGDRPGWRVVALHIG